MRTMQCKFQLPHPVMFAGKDAKTKNFNRSKSNVYHIIPHVQLRKSVPTVIFFFVQYEQTYGHFYVDTWIPDEMAQNLQVLKLKMSHLPLSFSQLESMSETGLIWFLSRKGDQSGRFSLKSWLWVGENSRKENHAHLQITWHISCFLLHPSLGLCIGN